MMAIRSSFGARETARRAHEHAVHLRGPEAHACESATVGRDRGRIRHAGHQHRRHDVPPERVEPLPFVKISEPTVAMTFSVNDSPLRAGGQVRDLPAPARAPVAASCRRTCPCAWRDRAPRTPSACAAAASCTCPSSSRRCAARVTSSRSPSPRCSSRRSTASSCEPIERLVADVPEEYAGAVIEKIGPAQGRAGEHVPAADRVRLEFLVPARGLFGYRSEFLTDTRGEGDHVQRVRRLRALQGRHCHAHLRLARGL